KPGMSTILPVNLPVPTNLSRPPVTQHLPYPVNDNVNNFEPFKYDSFQYDIPYNYMLKSNIQSGFNQVTFKNVTNAENKRDQKEQKAVAINENQIMGKGERKRKAADDNVERWSNEEMSQLLNYLEENYT
ncbi:14099_t:CDS:2, partial [Rhizophagus irregularis]